VARPTLAVSRAQRRPLSKCGPFCARGRAKLLFGFDYVWEVYKPEHKCKFGYYTLPILWSDRLVARFDTFLGASKLDLQAIREPRLRRVSIPLILSGRQAYPA
jgi:uncharacterized protein YcaQ